MRTKDAILEFYDKEQKNPEWNIPLVNGKKNGIATQYHPSGKIKILRPYKNDKPHGTEEIFYEDGTKYSEISYIDGKKDGCAKVWDRTDGTLTEANYSGDKRHGPYRRINKEGEVIYEQEFIDGVSK